MQNLKIPENDVSRKTAYTTELKLTVDANAWANIKIPFWDQKLRRLKQQKFLKKSSLFIVLAETIVFWNAVLWNSIKFNTRTIELNSMHKP